MYHYVESIQDTKGNSLTGYYIGLVEPDEDNVNGGAEAVIYADDNGTPIVAESGLENRAKVDGDGNVSLYVTVGDYHVDIYAPDGVTKTKRLLYIPMKSGENGVSATVTIGTVTTVSPGTPASVTNSGDTLNAILDFEIPQGATGSGTTFAWGGATGTLSDQTDLQAALDLKANLASPAFTGTPTAPTATLGDNSTKLATTAYVLANAAGLASPAFTGTPTAPTATADTNTTQIATTAFYCGQANSTNSAIVMNGTQNAGSSLKFARADHVHPTDTSRAPLASPGFTGTPTAPTATAGTNTTQIATTAFVQTAVAAVSDQWTQVKLTSDATGSSSSNESTGISVSGATFTANKYYIFEAVVGLKVSAGSHRIGLSWPSGVTGAASVEMMEGTTLTANGGDHSSTIVVTTSTTPTSFIPVLIKGYFYTGGSAATGTLDIIYRQNIGGGTHTASKGSYLRYRSI